jgi:glycosyltransferase involved in cell wall biosynthesis
VRPHLRACTVYVLPSYREGMPSTVLEAMAIGRAIVTTDTPGCRETVIEGDNGFLVPTRDAGTLAEAMRRFIIRPELAISMGERSRKTAEQRFDVHRINAVMLEALGLVRAPCDRAREI